MLTQKFSLKTSEHLEMIFENVAVRYESHKIQWGVKVLGSRAGGGAGGNHWELLN